VGSGYASGRGAHGPHGSPVALLAAVRFARAMQAVNGRAAAEASRPHFDLQLRFAATLARRSARPLVEALTFHTQLHRRLAYGNVARTPPDPAFLALAQRVAGQRVHRARLDLIVSAFAERPAPAPPARAIAEGCFRFEPPDARGHVRIHFRNRDSTGELGPLHHTKAAQRRAEIAALVALLMQRHPDAQAIDGGSWLYNLESYRRLFPVEFVDSRRPVVGPRMIHGGSTWGQFLDFRGAVKPAMRDAFLTRLEALDPAQPWSVFEHQALKTTAPLECFRREYGV
jgi:hypothetical protein